MSRRVLFILSLLAAAPAALFAGQDVLPTHTITGIVSGPPARVLPGVTVELAEITTPDVTRVATTDSQGAYRFDQVLTGIYVLTYRLPGFATEVHNVTVTGGGETRLDVHMTVAGPGSFTSPGAAPQPKVVCGMTIIPVQPSVDPKGVLPALPATPLEPPSLGDGRGGQPGPRGLTVMPPPIRYTMRYVEPSICGSATAAPPTPTPPPTLR
jgi:hypothetical protein